MSAKKSTVSMSVETAATPRRRTRRGRKRLVFQVPSKMPLPIKALWEAASEEQRSMAHRTATAILATWLGKTSREAAARELGLSAIRVWQLSQQATCGLVVGCLRQPRFRGRPPADALHPGIEGATALRTKVMLLERELDASRRLIEVMRDLPGNRGRALAPESEAKHERGRAGAKRRAARAADDASAGGAGTEAHPGAGA